MNAPATTLEPALRPVSMGLFPTMGSLQEVVDYADSQLPITSKNGLTSLLMIYHNTLLDVIRQQRQDRLVEG